MIDNTILHYPPKGDKPLAHKILEKLDEGALARQSHFNFGDTL